MSRINLSRKGIFCLEGDWWGNLKRPTTVKPILELLRQCDPYFVPYVHRDVGTREEFEYYLQKWVQKTHINYPILYLAFHGNSGEIYVGDLRWGRGVITLEWLEEKLHEKCKGRIIFFGTCSTLDLNGHRINRFLKRTGALAVCGYRIDVEWLNSAAFELMILSAMQENSFTINGARAIQTHIRKQNPYLVKEFKFRMVIKKPQ